MEYYYNDIPSSSYFSNDNLLIGGFFFLFGIFVLIFILTSCFSFVYNWIIYKKAGRKGWEALIPIYNLIVKFQFLNIPLWLIVLYFIPGANIATSVITGINMAKKFDKDNLFAIGLIVLPFVFYPILAFGNAKFNADIKGLFDDNIIDENNDNTFGYCTNCGSKMYGEYCSNCGARRDI